MKSCLKNVFSKVSIGPENIFWMSYYYEFCCCFDISFLGKKIIALCFVIYGLIKIIFDF